MTAGMKDSGVEWIGEIPEEWSVKPLKAVLKSMGSGGTPDAGNASFYDGDIPFVTIADMTASGDSVYETAAKITNEARLDKCLVKFPKGTLLYSIYATLGSTSRLMVEACVNQAILAMTPSSSLSVDYLEFVLKAIRPYAPALASSNTQQNLNARKVRNYRLPFPNLNEQIRIAGFLKERVRSVEEAVELIGAQIDVLERCRKAVIHEAVTKGLDPTVAMKPSGVEWIGDIPEHWEVRGMGYVGKLGKGLPILKTDLVEEGVAVISYGQIHAKSNRTAKMPGSLLRYIPRKLAPAHSDARLQSGDLVFADTSEDIEGVGNASLITDEPEVYAGYHTVSFRPDGKRLHGHYLFYLTQSDLWRAQLRAHVMGVKVFSVTQSILCRAQLLLPPLSEQQEIADYLDSKTAKIDAILDLKRKQVDVLKRRRQSLIYEYVTGKKRVGKEE